MKTLSLRCEGYHRTAYHRVRLTPLLRGRILFYMQLRVGQLEASDPDMRRSALYQVGLDLLRAAVDCRKAEPTPKTREQLRLLVDEVLKNSHAT